MEQAEFVEVNLLKYIFKFKRMRWREEFAISVPPKASPQRIILAHALVEVSGIKPKTVSEAIQVMDSVPMAIVERVFRIWKGSFPPARYFTSSRLYKAPEPLAYARQQVEEEITDNEHDRAMKAAESKFDSQQIRETKELEKKIIAGAQRREGGYRGPVMATRDEDDNI